MERVGSTPAIRPRRAAGALLSLLASAPRLTAILGRLSVTLDSAQIVKPPRGLEVGCVPIVTRQELPQKR